MEMESLTALKIKVEALERKVKEAGETINTLTQEKSEAEEIINTLTVLYSRFNKDSLRPSMEMEIKV